MSGARVLNLDAASPHDRLVRIAAHECAADDPAVSRICRSWPSLLNSSVSADGPTTVFLYNAFTTGLTTRWCVGRSTSWNTAPTGKPTAAASCQPVIDSA